VRLPTKLATGVIDEVPSHRRIEDTQSAAISPFLKNLRVLVVDDEEGGREITAAILVEAEAKVRTAATASEALKLMDDWQPEVLAADIVMPGVDGYQFIRRVRARSSQNGGNVPAAALTAYARIQDRFCVLSAGYQMHVPKPIQPEGLVTVVASLAKRLG
jgi:CheY-like chemotaxis protein